MAKANTRTEMSKGQSDNTNNATKSSITQRLQTDLRRSVGVTTATKLLWFPRFTGRTLPLPARAVYSQFVPIGIPTVCWKTFPAKTTKILSTKNFSLLMMSSSEYLFLESDCFFTNYDSSCIHTKYLYLRLPFLKMKASRSILASLFFNFWRGLIV